MFLLWSRARGVYGEGVRLARSWREGGVEERSCFGCCWLMMYMIGCMSDGLELILTLRYASDPKL